MAGASRKKQDTDSRKGTAARQKNTSAQAAGSRAKGGAGRPGAGRSRAAAQPLEEENSFMGTEVAIIVTFAVSVLLFLRPSFCLRAPAFICPTGAMSGR